MTEGRWLMKGKETERGKEGGKKGKQRGKKGDRQMHETEDNITKAGEEKTE